jgi:5-methylcytosine-specific restriction endonuclease McrA
MKLTIELVPKTCWYTNVRSNVSKSEWDVIRKHCYEKSNHICEICGDTGFNQGARHAVECHEIWSYDDNNFIQKLEGLISLCPMCHKTKHVGLAQMNGQLDRVAKHLSKVNNIKLKESYDYIDESFKIWSDRSKFEWEINIKYLDTYLPNKLPGL